MMSRSRRILIFTGDGKGKTTAALGMAFRASGHNMRTCICQFIKGDLSVGEVAAAAASDLIEMHALGIGFVPPTHDARFAVHREAAQKGVRTAAEQLASDRFGLVVLDEICLAVAMGLVEESQVFELMATGAPETTLVLTGRSASPSLIARADTVTEMLCIKHGMLAGYPAQDGVER